MTTRGGPPDGKPTVKLPAARELGAAPRPLVPRPTPAAPIAVHRDAVIEAKRQKSDAELENASTLGAVIAHTKKLGEAVTAGQRKQDDTNSAQNAALVILARELGVQDKLPPILLQSLPPPPASSAPPPPPVLGRLERRAKSSQIVQLIIAIAVIVEAIRAIVAPIHH